MKVTAKLLFWVLAAHAVAVAIFAYTSYTREEKRFKRTIRGELTVFGHMITAGFENVWRHEDEASALNLLSDMNAKQSKFRARFVLLEGATDRKRQPISPSVKAQKMEQTFEATNDAGARVMCAYFPVALPGVEHGAIEITHSLEPFFIFTTRNLHRFITTSIILIAIVTAVIFAAGYLILGRRLQRIGAMIRQIDGGNYVMDPQLESSDEIGELAGEFNQMSTRLSAAREELIQRHSEKLNLQQELRHQERLALLGKIAAGLSHELGTPLNVVGSRAKMIADGRVEADGARDSADIIAEQARRMTAIIQQFLSLGRRQPMQTSEVDIVKLVEGCVNVLQTLADQADVRCVVDVLQDEIPLISADRARLQQLFTNTIVNALQASPKGKEIHIQILTNACRHPEREQDNRCVTVRIIDHGEGIPADAIAKVFDPFFSTKAANEGTGLGLAIAEELARDHGGWIEVESEPGQGTTFALHLPIQKEGQDDS